MSDQADAVNRAIREKLGPLPGDVPAGGAAPPGSGGTDEGGAGAEKPRERPAVELPRDGRSLSRFAWELGAIAKTNGMFIRGRVPVTIAREKKKASEGGGMDLTVEIMSPEKMRTYGDKLAFIHKLKATGEEDEDGNKVRKKVESTMKKDVASGVLASDDFKDQQRRFLPGSD